MAERKRPVTNGRKRWTLIRPTCSPRAIDDYNLEDLPAIARLTYWAGMLGCRVLVSSATMPPALAAGLFAAYREGRAVFQKNRGER